MKVGGCESDPSHLLSPESEKVQVTIPKAAASIARGERQLLLFCVIDSRKFSDDWY